MGRVLITGCSSGIGRATAMELARRGHDVVATARRPESLADLDVERTLALDVDDDASVVEAVSAAGDIDTLVNNAGWGVIGPVETVPLDEVRAMFETNVLGVLRMVQAVTPGMRSRGGGTIVNVSSVVGRMAWTPLNGLYASSKHAVEAISETMHMELGRFGIRVAIVEPGYTATAWSGNERWLGVDDPPWDALYRQVHADDQESLQSAVAPELVAEVIAEAIETDTPRLRWPAGPAAELALQVRAELGDDEWERVVRSTRDIDW